MKLLLGVALLLGLVLGATAVCALQPTEVSKLSAKGVDNPARRPAWLAQNDSLSVVWEVPLSTHADPPASFGLPRWNIEFRYGTVARTGAVQPSPIGEVPLAVAHSGNQVFPHYQIYGDGSNVFLATEVFEPLSGAGLGTELRFLSGRFTTSPNALISLDEQKARYFPERTPANELRRAKGEIDCRIPAVAASGERWALSWRHDAFNGARRLYLAQSQDRGHTWTEPRKLLDRGTAPAVTFDAKNALVTAVSWPEKPREDIIDPLNWPEDTHSAARGKAWPASGKLLFWRVPENGAIPQPAVLVETEKVLQSSLVGDGKSVHVAYVEQVGFDKTALRLISSPDGGKTWGAPKALTDGKHIDREPALAIYQGELWIAYAHSEFGRLASVIHCQRVKL